MGITGQRVEALATRQHGLFSRAQARTARYAAHEVRTRLATGEWQVVLGPVLAFRGMRPTPALVDRAVSMTIPDAVLAGPSAARLHGFPLADRRTWIVVPAMPRSRLPGVGVLRDRLDRALQQRWTTLADLTRRVGGFAGRHGAVRLVRPVADAGTGARSAAERLAIALLRGAGSHGWRANVPIHDAAGRLLGIADLVFAADRVIVEIDGRAFHSTPERFESDRAAPAGGSPFDYAIMQWDCMIASANSDLVVSRGGTRGGGASGRRYRARRG